MFIFTGIFFLAFLILLEIIKRRFKIDSEYTRKFAHVFGGLAVIMATNYINQAEYLLLSSIFLFIFIVSFHKKLFKSFNGISRKSYGEITYMLGLITLGYLFFNQRDIFIPALLILIFPDAIAGLVGYQINKSTKTLMGSLIYFLVTMSILIQFFSFSPSLLIALSLSLVEFLSPYGLDNLTVPLAFSFLVKILL